MIEVELPRRGGREPADNSEGYGVVLPELERLLNDLVPFAERSLDEHGGFDPFGGTITMDTAMEHISVERGDSTSSDDELCEAIVLDLKEGANQGAYLATAILRDVQIEVEVEGQEIYAIHVVLEHVCGICIEIFIPYRQTAGAGIEYGERIANKAVPRVFSSAAEGA